MKMFAGIFLLAAVCSFGCGKSVSTECRPENCNKKSKDQFYVVSEGSPETKGDLDGSLVLIHQE